MSSATGRPTQHRDFFVCLAALILFSSLATGLMAVTARQWGNPSVYDVSYLVGPTVQSLVSGKGLLVCTEDMGTPRDPICFKSARMPLAPAVLALGVKCLGDRPKRVALCKDLLLLIPLWIAVALVLRGLWGQSLAFCTLLLVSPFFIYDFVGVVRSLEVEEGYFFGLLALALAVLFFAFLERPVWLVGFAAVLDLIYLSKSSMLAVVFVLLLAGLTRLPNWRSRALLTGLVMIAPLLWGSYERHASGRFTLGTSLDGLNFHKGNNAEFLNRYPPRLNNLDRYDWELNRGIYFRDEWTFNDYHLAQGKAFVAGHAGFTGRSIVRKLNLLLFTVNRYGPVSPSAGMRGLASAGAVLFRSLFWTSLLLAISAAWTGRGIGRFNGITYLLVVAAYCFPYLVGFGYMRHAIVLAYPSAIVCCLAVRDHRIRDAKRSESLAHEPSAAAWRRRFNVPA